MYKRPGTITYTFYYKTTDTMTYLEHYAEYNIQASSIMEAQLIWDQYAADVRASSWDMVELIRVVPQVSHNEFEAVKWIIEG